MTDKIRIGIIGTGWFADTLYLPAIKSHPNGLISAICGRNQARAQEMAAKYAIPRVYADYRRMLDDGDLDAVIVYTPDDLHYPMTMAALDAGLHVICDKPLALSAAQAHEMYIAAEAKRRKHMVTFTNRGLPYFRYFKSLLDQTYIGTPYHAHFEWLTGWIADSPGYQWYFDPARCNGTIASLGSHTFDLARWYLGDVARVSASLGNYVRRIGLDGDVVSGTNDAAFVLLEFVNGVRATVQLSVVNRAADGLHHTGEIVLIHGSEGSLELRGNAWSQPPVAAVKGFRRGMDQAETLPVPDEFYDGAGRNALFDVFQAQSLGPRLFIDAILNNTPIVPDFYNGYKVQQIIDAALESDRSGRAVGIDNS